MSFQVVAGLDKSVGLQPSTCMWLLRMQATVMVVSVTASTTAGQPLSEENLQKLLHACDVALQLDKDKADILKLVQMKMHHIAPNLSAAVGTEIAARLMGIAGGLTNLSKMPACNVQVSMIQIF